MAYNPQWIREDQRRLEWLDKLYRLDGRHHDCHPKYSIYTGLVEKYGPMPWQVS